MSGANACRTHAVSRSGSQSSATRLEILLPRVDRIVQLKQGVRPGTPGNGGSHETLLHDPIDSCVHIDRLEGHLKMALCQHSDDWVTGKRYLDISELRQWQRDRALQEVALTAV